MSTEQETDEAQEADDAKALTPAAQIGYYLDERMDKLETCLNGALPFDRFKTMAMNCIRNDDKLARSTPGSVFKSLMQAAEVQLFPGGPLQHCFLLPFYSNKRKQYECTFIMGYRGMLALCHRSEKVKKVEAHTVHEDDYFEIQHGHSDTLIHRPDPWVKRSRANCLGVYAMAWLENGAVIFERMSREEVEEARQRSKSKDSGPWVTDWLAMARKSAVRKLSRWLPLERKEMEAIVEDEARDLGYDDTPREAEYEVVDDPDVQELRELMSQGQKPDLAPPEEGEEDPGDFIPATEKQEQLLVEWMSSHETDRIAFASYCKEVFQVERATDLSFDQAAEALRMLEAGEFKLDLPF